MTAPSSPQGPTGAPAPGRWTPVYLGIVIFTVLLYVALYWFTATWNTPEA